MDAVAAGRTLAGELRLDVPPPFIQRGYHELSSDEPDGPVHQSEIWIWREPLPGPRE